MQETSQSTKETLEGRRTKTILKGKRLPLSCLASSAVSCDSHGARVVRQERVCCPVCPVTLPLTSATCNISTVRAVEDRRRRVRSARLQKKRGASRPVTDERRASNHPEERQTRRRQEARSKKQEKLRSLVKFSWRRSARSARSLNPFAAALALQRKFR